jgi:hypothetical protein
MVYPQHALDLVPADFHLFPRMKSPFRGRRFCDATDLIENATEELKMLLQNRFQNVSALLRSLGEVYSCTRRLF